jgi:hypothetical protein
VAKNFDPGVKTYFSRNRATETNILAKFLGGKHLKYKGLAREYTDHSSIKISTCVRILIYSKVEVFRSTLCSATPGWRLTYLTTHFIQRPAIQLRHSTCVILCHDQLGREQFCIISLKFPISGEAS